MRRKFAFLLIGLLAISGCSGMKIEDFADRTPELVLEDYFAGETRAWGIFEDRFGNLRRQFEVAITGTVDGDTLTLDERFTFADGETDRRVWTIRKTGPNSYEGRSDDTVGVARGKVYGNALNWVYDIDLAFGGRKMRVRFDDWLYLQPGGVLINRAYVSKWGIGIGQVTLFFRRLDDQAELSAPAAFEAAAE